MKLAEFDIVYFIGIGGIGMSALARYFLNEGKAVCGYDKTPSEITDSLAKEGVYIHFEDSIFAIPSNILKQKEKTLVVYTPAIPKDHEGYNYLKENGFQIIKRSEALGLITKNKNTIAVGGTHGKTSTSAIITHLLTYSNKPCHALLGGITLNYQSNFISPVEDVKSDVFVVEADEYDRSFLRLEPKIAVITNTDPDHLDIYLTYENLLSAFGEFALKVRKGGRLVLNEHSKIEKLPASVETVRYGLSAENDFYIENLRVAEGVFVFDIVGKEFKINDIHLNASGEHNILNTLGAVAAVHDLIPDKNILKEAIESYQGVKRRFEFVLKSKNHILIDDYAHHPSELNAAISTARKLFPNDKITGVFQPHLYSRTRDFAVGFAEVLSLLDKAVLLPVYPARELPIPGVESEMIYNKMTLKNRFLIPYEQLTGFMKTEENRVVLIMGAGDIDRLVLPVKKILENISE